MWLPHGNVADDIDVATVSIIEGGVLTNRECGVSILFGMEPRAFVAVCDRLGDGLPRSGNGQFFSHTGKIPQVYKMSSVKELNRSR